MNTLYSMCNKEVSKYIYKYRHDVKNFIWIKRCKAAKNRGLDCIDDDLKEKEISLSRRKDDCK